MRIACRARRGLRGLCRWNLPGCIRFHVPDRFLPVGRLPLIPPWFRGEWTIQTFLWSCGLRIPEALKRQDSPEQREEGQAAWRCCDRPPRTGAALGVLSATESEA